MTIYLDEDYAKVWVDESIPCIFTSIAQPPNEMQLSILAKKELICVKLLHKKNKELYSVTDLRDCGDLSQEMAFRYMIKIVLPEIASGLNCKLFIRPESKIGRTSLFHALTLVPNLKADVFSSFEEALGAINTRRVETV